MILLPKSNKQKHKKIVIIASIGTAVTVAVAVACLLFIFKENKPIQDEESMVDDLRDHVISTDSNHDDDKDKSESEDDTSELLPSEYYGDDNADNISYSSNDEWTDGMDRRIDFDYLHSINPDICAWLYMPNPYVDLPVLQEQEVGSTYYLNHNYTGAWSSNGSLLTPKIPGDMDDAHKLIFGHNMGRWQSVMFSALPRNFCYQNFAAENPYIYLYYPDRVERWVIWAAADAWSTDMIYDIPYTLGSDGYEDLLANIDVNKNYYVNDRPDKETRITVLSTCTGGGGSNTRFYLAYKPDAVKYYDQPETSGADSSQTDSDNSEDSGSEAVTDG